MKIFFVWSWQVDRRTILRPSLAVPVLLRVGGLKTSHNKMSHCKTESTKQFIIERYWWPGITTDIHRYVGSCRAGQVATRVPKYRTRMAFRLTRLFDKFSIDFAGPLPKGPNGEKYLWIAVENLTGRPVIRATTNDTYNKVLKSVREEIIFSFGYPQVIISDSGRCFTANKDQQFMKEHNIR